MVLMEIMQLSGSQWDNHNVDAPPSGSQVGFHDSRGSFPDLFPWNIATFIYASTPPPRGERADEGGILTNVNYD